MKFWTVASILTVTCTLGILALVDACTSRETAKDAYSAASHACLVAYDDGAHQKDCLAYVRARYTEAGAPPAAQGDAGHE